VTGTCDRSHKTICTGARDPLMGKGCHFSAAGDVIFPSRHVVSAIIPSGVAASPLAAIVARTGLRCPPSPASLQTDRQSRRRGAPTWRAKRERERTTLERSPAPSFALDLHRHALRAPLAGKTGEARGEEDEEAGGERLQSSLTQVDAD
jgi:hypothetical protein